MIRRATSLYLKHYARHLRYGAWRLMHRTGLRKIEPLPLVATLEEALAGRRQSVQFPCPTDRIVFANALGFGRDGWNPFSETARSVLNGFPETYEGSILHRYYRLWQPGSAAMAVAGLDLSGTGLRSLPAHGTHVTPWKRGTVDRIMAEVEGWHLRDMSQQGLPYAPIARIGFNRNGPVSDRLGSTETARLTTLLDRVRTDGYDRAAGLEIGELGIGVEVLKRGREILYLNCGGVHRTAVMDALGAAHVPVHLVATDPVDRADVDDWPHVRSGLWPRAEALRYFDHLFDFDSRGWARDRGLTVEQQMRNRPSRPDRRTARPGRAAASGSPASSYPA